MTPRQHESMRGSPTSPRRAEPHSDGSAWIQTCCRPGSKELHEALTVRVREWRESGYPNERYPAIAEILGFAVDGDGSQAPLRYLRAAQLHAGLAGNVEPPSAREQGPAHRPAHGPHRHGRFFEHRPAEARVTFERGDGGVRVTIDDVLSPSILERLAGQEGILQPRVAGQEGILQPRVADWRAMVDTVAIDPSYNGSVFEVGVLDVPARKRDLVEGAYEVEVDPAADDPVAVRITDMLGEEILVVEPRVPTNG